MFICVLLSSPVGQTFLSRSAEASPVVFCSILGVLKLHRISAGEATPTITGTGEACFSLSHFYCVCHSAIYIT